METVGKRSDIRAEWEEWASPADLRALTGGLSEHTLHELGEILAGCEIPDIRGALIAEVLRALPSYGDRAVWVACALVAVPAPPETEEHQR
jgi:hypothetical protein